MYVKPKKVQFILVKVESTPQEEANSVIIKSMKNIYIYANSYSITVNHNCNKN